MTKTKLIVREKKSCGKIRCFNFLPEADEYLWDFDSFCNLLNNNLGIDGLKTGKTNESGYSMIVSSNKDNSRLIGIIGGLDTKEQRTTEMKNLINYGQKTFKKYNLFKKSEIIDSIKVWEGNSDKLDLLISHALNLKPDLDRMSRADGKEDARKD